MLKVTQLNSRGRNGRGCTFPFSTYTLLNLHATRLLHITLQKHVHIPD